MLEDVSTVREPACPRVIQALLWDTKSQDREPASVSEVESFRRVVGRVAVLLCV